MKQLFLSLAFLLCVGGAMGQDDKAAAKAAAAALKAKQKEAKAWMGEAQKVYDAIYEKITAKTATDQEVMTECKKGQALIRKALKSGGIEEKKLGEAYKLSNELAMRPHNLQLSLASDKLPFDTVYFYDNLKVLTDALSKELKYTKVTTGEYGNEGAMKTKRLLLSQCGDYYIYAAQFETACGRYARALESYDIAMNYATIYPEVKGLAELRITPEQIAYYAFHAAHDAKMYDAMDKYYDKAIQFAEGETGTKQVKIQSYLEKGDTAQWAAAVREMTIKDPEANSDYIQALLSYYMKQSVDQMTKYADEVLAADPNVLIANYGKGYALFASEKYEEALVSYKKCTVIKPDYYDAWYQCGMCKFRQAMEKNATISSIKNQVKAKEVLAQTKALFGEAIPFFEKARDCAPDDPGKWAYELKQCYTVTGQAAKAAAMDKLL